MLEKIEKNLKKIYIVIANIAIVFVLTLANIDHIFNGNALNIIKTILFAVIIIAILFGINKLILNRISDKKKKIITVVGLVIFLCLEIVSYIYFKVEYNWDFKWLMESAMEKAKTGNIEAIYYFKKFPNNLGALFIVTTAMKLANNQAIGAYVVNILFIFLSAVFTVLTARKIGGEKMGVNAIILLIGFMPIYLNTPIVYTDSLSIAFPVATLYFWILAKEQRDKSKKKYYTYLSIMTILAVIAYVIKANAAIVCVAILIESIFNIKKLWKPIVTMLVTSIILIKVINLYNCVFVLRDFSKNEFEFPLTHWVMLGLNKPESEGGTSIGYGAYSQDDADYTAIQPTYQDKVNANKIVIKQRLKDFGVKGYIEFLFKKFKYVWNDGSYYVLNTIGWDTINQSSMPYRLVLGDLSSKFVRPYMTYFNDAIFILNWFLIIKKIIKKDMDEETRVIGTSIVGSAMFLLIWEARSRYIYLLIPLFAILSAMELTSLTDNTKKLEGGKDNI